MNVIPGRCEASNPESRDSGSGPSDHPGMTKEKAAPTARLFCFLASKIGRDALVFPVAIAGRFRALRPLELLRDRLGGGLRRLPARFGLRKRTLGRRRKLFALRFGWGRCRPCRIISHSSSPALYLRAP